MKLPKLIFIFLVFGATVTFIFAPGIFNRAKAALPTTAGDGDTLNTTPISQSQIDLSWTCSFANTDIQTIYRCLGSTCTPAYLDTVVADIGNYSSTGLSCGNTYRFQVDSAYGATNISTNTTDQCTPGTPTIETASPTSQTGGTVSWTPTSPTTQSGFQIESLPITHTETAGASQTSGSLTGFNCNTSYQMRVQAYVDTNGRTYYSDYSAYSNSFTTDPCTPTAPTSTAASVVSCSQINLTWTDTSNNESGFDIYRNSSYLTSVAANTVSYSNTGLASSTIYSYYVVAYATGNGRTYYSANSNTASATTPACNNPPNTPTLVSPPNNTWTNSRQFCATVSDPDAGSVTGKFVIGGTTYTGSTVTSGSNSCYTHTADLNGITWYAYAIDPANATSSNTATWTANIDTTAPSAPTLSSYTNNTEGTLTDGGRFTQQITISGSNFGTACDGTNNVVKIGTYSVPCANVSTWTATSIVFTVPSATNVYGGTGSNGLIVRASGIDSGGSSFYVYPSISSLVTPSVANAFREGDTGIQINGSRFGSATSTVSITLSGQSAVSSTITTWSDTQITITIPTALADTIDTGTLNLSRVSDSKTSNNWNIRVLPQITSLSPSSGIVGTVVNINGTHLGSDPGVGYRSTATDNIKFGSTQALESDISSWSATLIQVKVPSGVSAGTNTVVARRSNYDSNSSNFSVLVSFTQKDFRWYANADSLQPTDPWPTGATNLAENTTIGGFDSPPANADVLRLRINVTVGSVNLAAGSQSFKLQSGSSGSCTSTSWSDVDIINGSGVWRGYDNATPADGAALTGLLLSTSNATATYEEANNSANNPYAVSVGQNIEYDWVIQDNNAPSGTTYCFRMIKSDGTALNSYTNYPSLITKGLPNAPTSLGQYLANGATAVAVGGTASTQTIILKMTMTGVGSGTIYPQIEVKPITQTLDGSTNIFEGSGVFYTGSPVTGQVNLTFGQISNHTAFHWRARTRMNTDYSAWVSFGNNAD